MDLKRFCISFGLILAIQLNFFATVLAQNASSTQASGPKKQLSTIVVTGLGGAVLGLSTLSFYGRPQDNLSNIGIGFGVGIIIGTIYATYQAASSPKTFYSQQMVEPWRVLTSQTEMEVATMERHHGMPIARDFTFAFSFK